MSLKVLYTPEDAVVLSSLLPVLKQW